MLKPILVATCLIIGASTALAANVGGTRSYESQLSGATDTAIDFSRSNDWSGIVGGGVGERQFDTVTNGIDLDQGHGDELRKEDGRQYRRRQAV